MAWSENYSVLVTCLWVNGAHPIQATGSIDLESLLQIRCKFASLEPRQKRLQNPREVSFLAITKARRSKSHRATFKFITLYLFLHHIPLPKASHINKPKIKGQENMNPTRFFSSRSDCSHKVKKSQGSRKKWRIRANNSTFCCIIIHVSQIRMVQKS